jgi:L-cysteine desulfidase
MSFTFSEYLKFEWVPTLGCTEPASIAYAAATARHYTRGPIKSVRLRIDPRIFKNCFAVGIPHSDHRTGIKWALAIGSSLPSADEKLQCFRGITPEVMRSAQWLIDGDRIAIDVEPTRATLLIDCRITTEIGSSRVVIEGDHVNIVLIEQNDVAITNNHSQTSHRRGMLSQLPFDRVIEKSKSMIRSEDKPEDSAQIATASDMRAAVAALPFDRMIALAKEISNEDRAHLRGGVLINDEIAEHGLSLFPKSFVDMASDETLTQIAKLVCAGVYARMWGEDLQVMSLAGSGNKGITVSVPLARWGKQKKYSQKKIDEALALACLVTSATTHHLGTLSAVCGCSNAAGMGLAAGLVYLEKGGPEEINRAISNMVGNVSGMICDGAKIGCALKTMTAVDAAFRAASLAQAQVGIPYSDGIVGHDGLESLANLGRIAGPGMKAMDEEILSIMTKKLKA